MHNYNYYCDRMLNEVQERYLSDVPTEQHKIFTKEIFKYIIKNHNSIIENSSEPGVISVLAMCINFHNNFSEAEQIVGVAKHIYEQLLQMQRVSFTTIIENKRFSDLIQHAMPGISF